MIAAVEFLREIVSADDLWAAVSLVATVCAVGAVAYVMHYAVKMEEESVQRRLGAKGLKVDKKGKVVPELKIHGRQFNWIKFGLLKSSKDETIKKTICIFTQISDSI